MGNTDDRDTLLNLISWKNRNKNEREKKATVKEKILQ